MDENRFLHKLAIVQLLIILGFVLVLGNIQANEKLLKFINDKPEVCDIKVTSLKRTKEHNHKIGGAKNSLHLRGLAVDFVTNCQDFYEFKAKLGVVSIIKYKTHLHIDLRKKWACLVKTNTGFRFCN